jgi:hypothetical protein
MLAILKDRRRKSKQFVGVIGSYLIEMLGDPAFIKQMICKTVLQNSYSFSAAKGPRLAGPTRRMMLTTFAKDSLILFNTVSKDSSCELILLINNSDYEDSQIIEDAVKLACFRWEEITIGGEKFNLDDPSKQERRKILERLSLQKY